MAHYDTWAQGILDTYGLPGMSVAVMKEGRLVYARGFGVADPATNEPVRPQSRFRLASISKPITAAAAMWLVERGLLDLDAQAFAMLPDHPPLAGETEDPRLADITVRDLLQHSAGWDRDQTGYDPMFDVVAIGQANGLSGPAGCDEVIRFVRGRPLDFTPGTRYAYSNVGYCVLGRVMAEAARMSYHTLMQEFFATIGVGGMALGRTRFSDRLQDEVIYVEHYGQTCPSLLGEGTVPCPYGQFYIEAMDAHGGWVSSAPDLLRFVRAVDGRGGDDV
ncbi:MAG: serine hydrolase domain-containing protein, partial [Bacteroidota bacterium]